MGWLIICLGGHYFILKLDEQIFFLRGHYFILYSIFIFNLNNIVAVLKEWLEKA